MIVNDNLPPKYEELLKNDDSITTDATTTSSAPLTLTTTTSTNENIVTATPFRVNLISSTTPIFGPNPIETDCPYCQVCSYFLKISKFQ